MNGGGRCGGSGGRRSRGSREGGGGEGRRGLEMVAWSGPGRVDVEVLLGRLGVGLGPRWIESRGG